MSKNTLLLSPSELDFNLLKSNDFVTKYNYHPNYYQVGGSLQSEHNYVYRQADKELHQHLKKGEFCYVLNSRQMGKSSLRVKTAKRLKAEGIKSASIDLTSIGNNVTKEQWYKGFISELLYGFELDTKLDFNLWWEQNKDFCPLYRLCKFIYSVLLPSFSQTIVIFIDEIDSLINSNVKEEFMAFICNCYDKKAEQPDYKRLSFCLLGVASPSDLSQNSQYRPFNIGYPIELTGFTFFEAKVLLPGLQSKVTYPKEVLKEILELTGGQPFLTQKLCKLVVQKAESRNPNLKALVQKYIIENWESQDEPEHLKTIRNRLTHPSSEKCLNLYQKICQEGQIIADNSREQYQLRLSGLVIKNQRVIKVFNPIYQNIFNENWLNQQLKIIKERTTY